MNTTPDKSQDFGQECAGALKHIWFHDRDELRDVDKIAKLINDKLAARRPPSAEGDWTVEFHENVFSHQGEWYVKTATGCTYQAENADAARGIVTQANAALRRAREALVAAEEYLCSNSPANSYGLLDHAADKERGAALALVRAALSAPTESER